MDFPNCTLVNASPVNNGPATIYQTSGLNGQQTDLFSSGMQYSSKYFSYKIFFLKKIYIFQLLLVKQLMQQMVYNYSMLQLIHYLLSILSMLQQFIHIYQLQH
jgi:hypothetical protein